MSQPTKLRTVITGATGMVGEGVLYECLKHPDVEAVLVVNRKPCGYSHPKLTEIMHADFYNWSPIESQVSGYNTCFFCLGVSVIGMKEAEYFQKTYTLTLHVAQTLLKQNPNMVFSYISGAGTDSSEKGKQMWARIKGKTENDLMKLPFKKIYAFRPGYMQPTKGLNNTLAYYKYFDWMYPVLRILFPNFVSTLAQLGLSMIHVTTAGYAKNVLEVRDIVEASKNAV